MKSSTTRKKSAPLISSAKFFDILTFPYSTEPFCAKSRRALFFADGRIYEKKILSLLPLTNP